MAKKVQLSKKINGVAHQIYPKTVYDVVVDKNGKTLQQDITEINSDLERIEDSIPTKLSDLQGGAEIVTESDINAKLNNYYTKDVVDSKLEDIESGPADLKNYYTKNEVYNKSEVDVKLEEVKSSIVIPEPELEDYAKKSDLSEYAKKSELFSKNYDDLYNKPTIISESRVQELIDQAQFPEGGDIDLKNYYTKGEVDIALASKQNTLKDGINIKTINNKSILGSGNLTIDGGGSSIEIITSSDKTTQPSDGNVYSALKVDNEFTRNNERETINKQWQFEDKTVFNGNVEFNKTIQKPVKFEDHIQSPNYTGNVLGSGWYLGFDNGTNSHLEVDTLKVRKKAIFDTLEIKHVAHVGGEIMLTPAGAKISKVEDDNGNYKCFFKASGEDENGNQLNYQNEFSVDDLVMCKPFNLDERQQRYYWRKCIGVNYTPDENGYFWIILSKDDEDKLGTIESDSPIAGDVIVTVGNSGDVNRQNAIVISAYSSDAPSICLYKGIGTPDKSGNIYSLRDDIMPVRISPKGNKFTGNFTIENKDEVAGSLVEVLENLISFSVTGLSYNDLLGVNAVDTQVGSGSNYVTYSLKEDVVKTWQQGDNVAIKLRFNEEALQNKTNITIYLQGELQGKFDSDEQTIEAKDLENPSIKLFQRNGIGFESGDLHIQITGSENCLPYSVEARAGFNTELRRTGIDIENGRITLQSDATYIKTSDNDDPKTIAEFTEDKIALSTYEEVYKEVQGQNAVTGKQSFTDKSVYELDPNIVNKWEENDIITITFERPLKETIKIWSEVGLAEVLNEVTIDSGKTCASFTCLKSPSDTNSENYSLKVTPAINYDMEVRCSLKADLRRTGIDIEKGTITLQASETYVKTQDGQKTLAQFTDNKISFGLTEVNDRLDILDQTLINIEKGEITLDSDKTQIVDTENGRTTSIAEFTSNRISLAVENTNNRIDDLTGQVNNTSLILENGKITLDADETTIKDTDLTLAQFTKDQASISVYETIYNRVDGANAVKGTGTSGSNYQIFSLNKDIINLWKIGDVIEFTLSLTEPLNANQTITVVGINGLQNAIDSKTIPNTLFVNNIAQWTTKLNMSISDIGSLQNPAIRVALSNNSRINCTLTAKCSLKQDLKRTGIDIESGLITLDADKTVIKDGDDSFDIASFTKNQITLQTESEGNALDEEISYEQATESLDINTQEKIYSRTYKLSYDTISKWEKDDVIVVGFLFNPNTWVENEQVLLSVRGHGKLNNILNSAEISVDRKQQIVEVELVCKDDAANIISSSDTLSISITSKIPHKQGELEVYSKLYGKIKKAGIDLNDGTITLNAETTKIKSGEQDIALFTIDNEGRAVISADLIDAENIQAEVLKTRGSEDSNYISIKDNSLSMFGSNKYLKFLLHSGELISTTNSINFNISIPNTIGQSKTLSDGLFITEPFYIPAQQNILQIPPFNLTINKNWPINTGHTVYIYLYAVQYVDGRFNRTLPIGMCSTYENYPISSYTKEITFPNMTLSEGQYKLYMIAKASNGYKVTTTGVDIQGTAYLNVDRQEIASNGYNFNYSTDTVNIYQKGSSEGFEMICGLYGLKIDGNGIYVRGRGISDSVNWRQLDLSKLPFVN